MQKITFRAMGSQILIALDTNDTAELDQAWLAQEWFSKWEQVLSRFSQTSELSWLNQHTGKSQPVSQTMWDVLEISLQSQEYTNHLVTPLILNDLERAGYDITFEELEKNLGDILRQPYIPLPLVDARIELNETDHTVYIPQGYRIDLGGVAKGWAAHQTMLKLQHIAPVLVDAGGDIAISGPMTNGNAWPVGIANPFIPEQDVDLVMLTRSGIATSGRDYRRWQVDGNWQHHIIDPRLNAPAQTDIFSLSVIAEDVMAAEAAAKAGLILGSQEGISWLVKHPGLVFLMILENGETLASNGYQNYKWTEAWQNLTTTK
jgi:thiamine biosynthesis lipoprotein